MNSDLQTPPADDGRGQGNALRTGESGSTSMSLEPRRVIVHPTTGEVLIDVDPVETQLPDALARALIVARELERQVRDVKRAIEGELKLRLERRPSRRWVVGDVELELERKRRSVWDGQLLERVVRELVDKGVISAGEWTGVVRREWHVDRVLAKHLAAQLTGPAREAVNACVEWEDDPRASVKAVPSIDLLRR